jgi:hypothetical protein
LREPDERVQEQDVVVKKMPRWNLSHRHREGILWVFGVDVAPYGNRTLPYKIQLKYLP